MLLWGAAGLLLGGCSSLLPVSQPEPPASVARLPSALPGLEAAQSESHARVMFDSEYDNFDGSNALEYALSFTGARYRHGGTSPAQGFDCSGFVRFVFGHFGVELPRSARAMAEALPKVAPEARQPGDLVFFNTNGKPYSHVGIYLGDGRFVHATSAAGKTVKVSALDETYWRKRLVGVRRPPAQALAISLLSESLHNRL
jgi:cell wall-associated NlpC family hydrolase